MAPVVFRTGEGEEYCCRLYKAGIIDTIISKDIDVLAYSGINKLYDLTLTTLKITIFDKQKILESLALESEELLLDFFIMCGLDYNNRISNVGPARAFNYIKKYGCIENIEAHKSAEGYLAGKGKKV